MYAYFSEGQNTVIKLLVLLKYNSLMSWEEIDVPIFKKCFLLGRNDCFSGGGGINFVTKEGEKFSFFLHVGN